MKPKLFATLSELTEKKNIPLSCFIEITFNCNLNCIHCYNTTGREIKELDLQEVKDVLRQLKELNCLFLTFTGGEPFTRNDFLKILQYSREYQFATRIFTNGTLITEEIAKFLKEIGIYEVGISLYSADKNIHEKITRVKGSYDKTIHAFEILHKYNVNTRIKCPLMKYNYKNYREIIKIAERVGAKYHFDPTIVARDDGDKTPHRYRVGKIGVEKVYREIYQDDKLYDRKRFKMPEEDRSFICSAGVNSVDISPFGNVYPCLQWRKKLGNVREDTLYNIWYKSDKIKWVRAITNEKFKECIRCDLKTYCPRCSGVALVEDHSSFGKSTSACRIAPIRKKVINQILKEYGHS